LATPACRHRETCNRVPGYDLKDRKLVINKKEAETVRTIFSLYVNLGSVRKVKAEIDRLKLRTKLHKSESGVTRGGLPFRIGHLYTILRNHLYCGQIKHRGEIHAGEHEQVIDHVLWDKAQAQLASNVAVRRSGKSSKDPSLLAGLLYDGEGNRMTPSHAVKNGKRYRYYISNHLIAGTNKSRETKSGEGRRIAAQEVEHHVITAITVFLTDPQGVVIELCPNDAAPGITKAALHQARLIGEELRAEGMPDRHECIRSLIVRVTIDDASICVELRRTSLLEKLGLQIDAASRDNDTPLQLKMRAELRRLGKEKRLIVAAHAPKTNPDPVLIKAIVRGHQWFDMLKSCKALSITDIANAETIPRTYVGSVIPFALLAPDITEAILEGTQPIDLNLDRLINLSLPIDWVEQRSVLGFK
jgi:site-specific DNA recombinase